MKFKKWKTAEPAAAAFARLREQGVPALVAAVLCARGLANLEEAQTFLSRDLSLLCDPFLMRDMPAAAARIGKALERGERIAVYGDYDVDGITSTCLLADALRRHSENVTYYIPSRLEEGYGLNRDAVDFLRGDGVQLIVTVDCGITAVDETLYARGLGIDLVITDHHECKGELPPAAAVVNPRRPDCPYPFKELAGVGVALKLVLALEATLAAEGSAVAFSAETVLARYADLAAVGTVADVMTLLGENRALVYRGLSQLRKTLRPGLAALLEAAGTSRASANSSTIGFCLAPRLNAAGRMGKAELAAELLLTPTGDRARELARTLCDLNRERQTVEQDILDACLSRLGEGTRHDCIVLADENWHQGVLGIVAARLAERYAAPAFMICLDGEGFGKGSARSYGAFELFPALCACEDLLVGFGGHAFAAGFTIKEENIGAFHARMGELVSAHTQGGEMISTLAVDVNLSDASDLSTEEVEKLSLLEPFGTGNENPVFSLRGAQVTCLSEVGGGKHLKLRVTHGKRSLDAIFFAATREQAGVQVGDRIDLAFVPQINEFRGLRSVQLRVSDLRPAAEAGADTVLYRQLRGGEFLTCAAAEYLTPSREEFAAVWRYLSQRAGADIRTAAVEMSHIPAVRVAVCFDVMEQCRLLQKQGETVTLLPRPEQKANLDTAPLMQKLKSFSRR
jgi:single-stranded-DNA-specific exonuclease